MTTDIPTLTLDDLDREEMLFVIRRAQRVSPEHMAVLMSPADLWDARAERLRQASGDALTKYMQLDREWWALSEKLLAARASSGHNAKFTALAVEHARLAVERARLRCDRRRRKLDRQEEAAHENARRLREQGR